MLGAIIDAITNIVKEIILLPVKIVEGIVDFFKAPLDTILEFLINCGEWFLNIIDFIINFFSNMFDFILGIFVPEADYFKNEFTNMLSIVGDKFNIDFSAYESLKNLKDSKIDDIQLTVMGVSTTIKMDIVNNIASVTRTISTGCVVLFSILFNYNKIVFILRGRYAVETRG